MLSNKPGPKDALSPISIGVVPRSGGGGGGGRGEMMMGERESVRRKTRQEREREKGKKVERCDGVLE